VLADDLVDLGGGQHQPVDGVGVGDGGDLHASSLPNRRLYSSASSAR
jgi:hypothetical protein